MCSDKGKNIEKVLDLKALCSDKGKNSENFLDLKALCFVEVGLVEFFVSKV